MTGHQIKTRLPINAKFTDSPNGYQTKTRTRLIGQIRLDILFELLQVLGDVLRLEVLRRIRTQINRLDCLDALSARGSVKLDRGLPEGLALLVEALLPVFDLLEVRVDVLLVEVLLWFRSRGHPSDFDRSSAVREVKSRPRLVKGLAARQAVSLPMTGTEMEETAQSDEERREGGHCGGNLE